MIIEGRQLVGITVCTDFFRLVETIPRPGEAASEKPVTWTFGHKIGLPAEERLVDLKPAVSNHCTVGDNLVAGSHTNDVALNEFLQVGVLLLPIADDADCRAAGQRDLIEHAFGIDFLTGPNKSIAKKSGPMLISASLTRPSATSNDDRNKNSIEEIEDIGMYNVEMERLVPKSMLLPAPRSRRASASASVKP